MNCYLCSCGMSVMVMPYCVITLLVQYTYKELNWLKLFNSLIYSIKWLFKKQYSYKNWIFEGEDKIYCLNSICVHVQKQVSSNQVLDEKNGFAPIKMHINYIQPKIQTEMRGACKSSLA